MLFDPDWVDEVYADATSALAGFDLSDVEKAWLCLPDKRRWKVDSQRQLRSLQTLLEEYPVAFAQGVALGGIEGIRRFFRSEAFLDCIMHDTPLALSFGHFLATWPPSVSRPAMLEHAMAAVRRAETIAVPEATGRTERWQTSRLVIPLTAPARTLKQWARQQEWLLNHDGGIVDAVLSPNYPRASFTDDQDEIGLLVTREADVNIGECSYELACFLLSLVTPRTRAEVEGQLITLGAESKEFDEIIDNLVEDGLLVFSPPH